MGMQTWNTVVIGGVYVNSEHTGHKKIIQLYCLTPANQMASNHKPVFQSFHMIWMINGIYVSSKVEQSQLCCRFAIIHLWQDILMDLQKGGFPFSESSCLQTERDFMFLTNWCVNWVGLPHLSQELWNGNWDLTLTSNLSCCLCQV